MDYSQQAGNPTHGLEQAYSQLMAIQDPEELSKRFAPLAQLDINRAAEVIKQINPEKYKFLQIYK